MMVLYSDEVTFQNMEREYREEIVRLKAEVERLTADNAKLVQELEKRAWVLEGENVVHCAFCLRDWGCTDFAHTKDCILRQPHPGQVLLDRMAKLEERQERLEAVARAANKVPIPPEWSRVTGWSTELPYALADLDKIYNPIAGRN